MNAKHNINACDEKIKQEISFDVNIQQNVLTLFQSDVFTGLDVQYKGLRSSANLS